MKIEEKIVLDVEVGDTILVGRFKNKKLVVKDIGKDSHGMPTINGRKVTTFRILKTAEEKIKEFKESNPRSCLCEKCWKGYKIHPTRKTKKLFGKTYPNCIKKEDTLYIEAMSAAQAKAAHKKFKQTGELPPHLKKLVKDIEKVKVKYKVKNIVVPGLEWMADIDEGFASDAQRRAAFASGYKAKGKKKKEELDIQEDGHTDVASAIRQCKTILEDSMQVLQMQQQMFQLLNL